jgi:hypothetical protein
VMLAVKLIALAIVISIPIALIIARALIDY